MSESFSAEQGYSKVIITRRNFDGIETEYDKFLMEPYEAEVLSKELATSAEEARAYSLEAERQTLAKLEKEKAELEERIERINKSLARNRQ